MSLVPPEEAEHLLMGHFVRLTKSRDRRPGGTNAVHHATGLPNSVDNSQTVSGDRLALECVVPPRQLAGAVLRREVPGDGPRALNSFPPAQWTAEECAWVDALEIDLKVAAMRLNERHGRLFDVTPPGLMAGERVELGNDGLPVLLKITWQGLEHAKRALAGTRHERPDVGIRGDLGREATADMPAWKRGEA